MPKAEIKKCTVADLEREPNFVALLEEYAVESAILGLPHPSARIDLYKALENSKVLYVSSAHVDSLLVGFMAAVSPINPHYGVAISASESLFVGKQYRKSGAGLKLIRAAEKYAEEYGSAGLMISAPIGSDLAEVLPHLDYVETNRVFFKNFTENTVATIPSMSDAAVQKVYQLIEVEKEKPQVKIATSHILHGGMYCRTIKIPAGVLLTGALVKIPTILIVQGDVVVHIDGKPKELHGYNTIAAGANRKQAFVALTDTYLSMSFPTNAKTVREAEEQFTDEADLLFSRKSDAINNITSEEKCLVE